MPDAIQSMRLERQLAWILLAVALMMTAVVHGLSALPVFFTVPQVDAGNAAASPPTPATAAVPQGIALPPPGPWAP